MQTTKSEFLETDTQLNEEIKSQLDKLERGTQYVQLLRPASVGGGIFRLSDSEIRKAVQRFEGSSLKKVKFVPASGAATRMFKQVFAWIENPDYYKLPINAFFEKVEQLAFFDDWVLAADRADVETFETGLEAKVRWLELLLYTEGLGLSKLPKGLIHFHQYEKPQMPIVEHLKEALEYAQHDGVGRVHFTVSPEHLVQFQEELNQWIASDLFSSIDWEISFSHQDQSTDTIAVDLKNEPIIENGKLLKRPGGHGALINNLNLIDADLVFIKNIDNVAHDRLLPETVKYKKVLAGKLLELREDLSMLHNSLGKGLVDERHIQEFRDKWKIRIPKEYRKLKAYLKRPMRVCGMVKNQGEPGGGPFWTTDSYTGESLQIVEQAQIDPSDSRQQNILKSATHFNPVDLVCSLKTLSGEKIDLAKYINHDLYFIANKSFNGAEIKALEWPGLWNGAMANWITIFVEVPIETFNPVKELSDLFRTEHLK